MNPGQAAYLRGLEREFTESSNAIRMELTRFERAGLLFSYDAGNKRMYEVNRDYPLYNELQSLAIKHFGLDRIIEEVIEKLGDLKSVYLTGQLARGLDSRIIDLAIITHQIDRSYLADLVAKAEKIVGRKIRTMVLTPAELETIPEPRMLLFAAD